MTEQLDLYAFSVLLTIYDYAAGKLIERDLTVRAHTEDEAIRKARRQWDVSTNYAVTHAVAAPITTTP